MFAALRGRGSAVSALRGDRNFDWSLEKEEVLSVPVYRPPAVRNGYRGRSRARATGGGFSGDWRAFQVPQPPSKDFLEGLRPDAIQTIKQPLPMDVEEVKIKDVTYHASYTWMDSVIPTIIVPGECYAAEFSLCRYCRLLERFVQDLLVFGETNLCHLGSLQIQA